MRVMPANLACTAKLTAGELLISASAAFASNPAMSFRGTY
jgi:hypothetical protein